MENPSDREPGATEPAIPAPARPRPDPVEESDGDPMIGREVDHYRILGHLGGGGMGVVYRAEDRRLQRTVALKFLPPALTRDPDSRSRFLQEARAASALDHPNVCTVYDVGRLGDDTEDGRLYLAMPAYDGETVKEKIERGPLPVEEAVDIATQAARGLAKAHRQGIVHRDIKPANLMVTGDGLVKILDFGLAKLAGAMGLTRSGFCPGTPSYMSPEQARGEVDHRTDLWSLGVVLYEMLTGRAPFEAESDPGIVHAVLHEEPAPLRRFRPDAPAELERIVAGLLQKKLADRYSSAEHLLADLRALGGPPTSGRSPAELPRRRRLSVPLVLGLLAVLGVLGFLWRSRGEPPPARAAAPVRLTREPGSERQPSLSPRGDVFVYVKQDGGDTDLFWERVSGDNPRNLTAEHPQDDSEPAISPDGTRIVFRSEREGGGLFVMGATGESPRRLTRQGYSPAWSPDGTEIVYATQQADPGRAESRLWRVSAAGGEPVLVTRADAVQPSWSPQGRRIAWWGIAADSGERAIWTVRRDGRDPVRLLGGERNTSNPVWSRDGRLYFIRDSGDSMSLWRVRIDEETGRALGDPEPLRAPTESISGLSLAGDRLVYATGDRSSNVERVAFDPERGEVAGAPDPVTQGSWAVRSADLSPDGEWIVFDTWAPQDDLFLVRTDGSGRLQLLDDVHKDRIPRWSPDGRSILFYSNRSGKYEAWRIRPDGSGLEQLTRLHVPVFNPIWSPDGLRIAFSRGFQGSAMVDLRQPIARRAAAPLLLAGSDRTFLAATWSADGRRLAGYTDVGGIFVYSFGSRRLERVAEDGRHMAWLHGSPRLLYLEGESLFLLDTASRSSRRLMAPPPSSGFQWVSVSRDDRLLLLVRREDEGDIWMIALPR